MAGGKDADAPPVEPAVILNNEEKAAWALVGFVTNDPEHLREMGLGRGARIHVNANDLLAIAEQARLTRARMKAQQ